MKLHQKWNMNLEKFNMMTTSTLSSQMT